MPTLVLIYRYRQKYQYRPDPYLIYILLRGLSAPAFSDRGVWWKVLQVHGQGGHGKHEDPPDGAAHQHAQHDRGISNLVMDYFCRSYSWLVWPFCELFTLYNQHWQE